MIKSVSYDQTEILTWILKLHCPYGFECDPTYGRGNFYKNIPKPQYRFDINPQTSDTIKASATNLPLPPESLRSIVFDPPFLATTGPSLKKKDESNKIVKRFDCFATEASLFQFYRNSLEAFYKLLKIGGTLIVKCQDKVSSGRQHFSHCHIYNMAMDYNYSPIDFFILLSKNRMVPQWQLKNQKHARKFHSYFWVFKK